MKLFVLTVNKLNNVQESFIENHAQIFSKKTIKIIEEKCIEEFESRYL